MEGGLPVAIFKLIDDIVIPYIEQCLLCSAWLGNFFLASFIRIGAGYLQEPAPIVPYESRF
uniref:Uncharacterized protein n=1 Tax=Oryza nivara TaxID=4536 RepID=A0A0E0FML8_ORYNI